MFQKLKALFSHEQTTGREKLISGILSFAYITGMGTYGQSAVQSLWYASLAKPSFQPPDWIFPIVWGILFFLISLAGYFVWNFYKSNLGRRIFALLFILNGLLMAAWTDQFFIKHSIGAGFITIILLLLAAEAMVITGFFVNKKASYILFPYLLWIIFAAYLNANYLVLNS